MVNNFMKLYLIKNIYNYTNRKLLSVNLPRKDIQKCGICVENPSVNLTMTQVQNELERIMDTKRSFLVAHAGKDHLLKYLPKLTDLKPRSMKDSFSTAYIPLATDYKLQDKYVSFSKSVRIGRLIEDIDIFSVWITFKHIKNPLQKKGNPSPYTILTVLVDKIDFSNIILQADQDIKLSGHVSWVGKSSLEVVVWIEQKQNEEWKQITRALMVMAARNSTLTGPAFVNPIQPSNETEEIILRGGAERRKFREKMKSQSLNVVIPNEDEQMVIHNLFLSTMPVNDVSLVKLRLPANTLWMDTCKLPCIVVSQPENCYLHSNTVYGGFIMKNSFEIGFSLAYMFIGESPKLCRISDVVYHKPIDLSSLIRMTAIVVYTQDKFVQIIVFVESSNKRSDKLNTANKFHYTYEASKKVKRVMPKSYHEAMLYISGKRQLERYLAYVTSPHTPKPFLKN